MRAFLKFSAIGLGLLLLAIAAAAILLAPRAEEWGRAHIETELGNLFATNATIDDLRIRWLRRGFELTGVAIDNPPSFKAGPAITCESVLVRWDLARLFSPAPTIREIKVDGIELLLRHEIGEGTNIGRLAKEAAALAEAQAGESGTGASRRLVVKDFSGVNGKIRLTSNLVLGLPISMKIPEFTLKDVTKGESMPVARVSAIFLKSLLIEAVTLKGLLRPVALKLQRELDGI